MTDESAKVSLTVIPGGSTEVRMLDPALTTESLDLMQAFCKITSADDRQKVIELAILLAKPD
ncbi:hypothetical protein [Bradyrhizobium prioriisuperbiae]|uniref:hypothetical protein n=1 Tax=Bradyrhizobium prioriisuperbiae TaxID=2854389 RepID=UPI0028E4843E|nr:hypothetical protein [Bradyrhizobium prioritasuperba]